MPDNSFSKDIFPNIQSKPPLTQLEAIKRRGETAAMPGREAALLSMAGQLQSAGKHCTDLLQAQTCACFSVV